MTADTANYQLTPVAGAKHLDATEILDALRSAGYAPLTGPYEQTTADQRVRDRALSAAKAVTAYTTEQGIRPGTHDPEDVLRDLLNDLHHLADALGLDWDQVAKQYHYSGEISGE